MFVDSHAHIDGPEFDHDRDSVIQRALDAGVHTILNVGTGDPHGDAFNRAVALGESHESIYTAIGTHPHDARLYNDTAEAKTKTLIASSAKVVAWGEIGLDFHYDNSPRDVQMEVFEKQLRAAADCELPVIIHTREAESETIEILSNNLPPRRGVFHCFSSSMELAQNALALDFFISFSGIVTFKKAEELRQVAAIVPLDRLLIETDCPFLSPIPFRGKRNEPAHVVEVAKCLAELHGVDLQEIARVTAENFAKFTGIDH